MRAPRSTSFHSNGGWQLVWKEAVETFANLFGSKEAPDFNYKRRQFLGKPGVPLRSHYQAEEFFADQIIQGVFQTEAVADIFCRGALLGSVSSMTASALSRVK